MPHQCTGCGHTFEDGSKEMLGGCPECSGNTFQFAPEASELSSEPPSAASDAPKPPEAEGSTVASKVGRATTRVRDFVSGDHHAGSSGDAQDDRAPVHDDRAPVSDSDAPDPGAPEPDGPDSDIPHPDGPDPDAPWPDSSDAADPIRKGGFEDGSPSADSTPSNPSVSGGESDDSDIIDADARATERAVEDAEDAAQADARTGVASESEVDAAAARADTPSESVDPPSEEASAASEETGAASEEASAASAKTNTALSNEADASEAAELDLDGEAETPDGEPTPEDGQVVREPTGEEPDLAELREQLNDQFESIKILEPGQYELNLMELYDREEYIIALQENGRYVIQVPENFMGDRPDD